MSTQAPVALELHVAETVTALARTLYPHDGLSDEVYARVAAKLDEAADGDREQARIITEGVADLDAGTPFLDRRADERLAAAKEIEGSPFFELVRSTAVVEVYSDTATWRLLGYEGPSFAKGGYLDRGFNDLDWLPDPEQES
jgi:hypothetical protein